MVCCNADPLGYGMYTLWLVCIFYGLVGSEASISARGLVNDFHIDLGSSNSRYLLTVERTENFDLTKLLFH